MIRTKTIVMKNNSLFPVFRKQLSISNKNVQYFGRKLPSAFVGITLTIRDLNSSIMHIRLQNTVNLSSLAVTDPSHAQQVPAHSQPMMTVLLRSQKLIYLLRLPEQRRISHNWFFFNLIGDKCLVSVRNNRKPLSFEN